MKPARPALVRRSSIPLLAALGIWTAAPVAPTLGDESKAIADPSERGSLEDRSERVRGDSGRWRDEPRLQVSPPVPRGEGALSLDDWADSLELRKIGLSSREDTWILHQSEQIDDNDRLWVESIVREGERILVETVRATWEGNYFRNFTWYRVSGLNLGKLPPGDYEIVWIERSRRFRTFADPENPQTSWPADDEESGDPPAEWRLSFSVGP